jgi:hypothetical protein
MGLICGIMIISAFQYIRFRYHYLNLTFKNINDCLKGAVCSQALPFVKAKRVTLS